MAERTTRIKTVAEGTKTERQGVVSFCTIMNALRSLKNARGWVLMSPVGTIEVSWMSDISMPYHH